MTPKYSLYEIVSYQGEPFCIRDITYTEADQEPGYSIRLPSGTYLEAPESHLQATGLFESPFRYDELVQIFSADAGIDAETAALTGSRGIVAGIALDEDSGTWFFSVLVQNGEVFCFEQKDLEGLGLIVNLQGRYDTDAPDLAVRVEPATGHGIIIAGALPKLPGPVPLPFDLDQLLVV